MMYCPYCGADYSEWGEGEGDPKEAAKLQAADQMLEVLKRMQKWTINQPGLKLEVDEVIKKAEGGQ